MKSIVNLLVVGLILVSTSCENEEAEPSNYISVEIEGMSYTFIGRSIFEPVSLLFSDTLEKSTYLGGFIGSCEEGSTQFIDIRIPHASTGKYDLSDGVEFWLETENHYFFAHDKTENHNLSISITEYGDENERIIGAFTGTKEIDEKQLFLEGTFSLQRLPNNSNTFEVASGLCQ